MPRASLDYGRASVIASQIAKLTRDQAHKVEVAPPPAKSLSKPIGPTRPARKEKPRIFEF
jgi:hypothetical protein